MNGESEKQFRQVFEQAPTGMAIARLDGSYILVNEAFCKMLGYTEAELLALNFKDITHPDDLPRNIELFKKLVGKEIDHFVLEKRYIGKDGNAIWVDFKASAVRNPHGELQFLVGYISEITAKKLEEEAAREREEFYRQMFTDVSTVRLLTDPDTLIIIDANPAACRFYGYTEDEIKGLSISQINVLPSEVIMQKVLDARESGANYLFEHRLKNGDIRSVEVHLSPVRFKGKTLMHSIIFDVTNRKRAEEALRESEKLLRESQAIAGLGSYVLDVRSGFWRSSEVLDEIFGIDKDYVRTVEGWAALVHPDWQQRMIDYFTSEVIGKRIPFNQEYKIVRRSDGAERWVHGLGQLEFDDQNRIIKMVGTIQDITERKRAEEARKALEERLAQAHRLEAVGQFAGGIAHDFNNLLTGILGYCELVSEQIEKGSTVAEDIAQIREAAKKASDLTQRLLAFSRKQVIKPRHIDLNEVILSIAKLLNRVIGEAVVLDVIPGHKLGTVYADPGQMEQVIMNLAVNARDSMSEGGKLTIETENIIINGEYRKAHPWATPGRYALISVTDTGCGIPKEHINRIFDPFFTTKALGKGTGLGLSTVYGIVQQHNGMVNVYSEAGKGTTFKIYLPIVSRAAEDVGMKIEEKIAGGTETILVAEDDELVLDLTTRILKRAGYEVICVSNGADALKETREHGESFDLVLLDLVMPNLGGYETYQRIKELYPNMRFAFCSGYSPEAGPMEYINGTGVPILRKPFNPEELLRVVRSVLDR